MGQYVPIIEKNGMELFDEAVLAPAIVAVCRFLIPKILKILGFKV